MGFKVTMDCVIHKRSLEKNGDCAVEGLLQQAFSWNNTKDFLNEVLTNKHRYISIGFISTCITDS